MMTTVTNPPVVRSPNVDRLVYCEKHLDALPCVTCAKRESVEARG